MLDPKLIRETPDLVRAAIAKKHLTVDLDGVLALDAAWRNQLQEVEQLRSKQKAANTDMKDLLTDFTPVIRRGSNIWRQRSQIFFA